LDGDGSEGANELWINQGGAQGGTIGMFTQSTVGDLALDPAPTVSLALGDLDGDGDLDLGLRRLCPFVPFASWRSICTKRHAPSLASLAPAPGCILRDAHAYPMTAAPSSLLSLYLSLRSGGHPSRSRPDVFERWNRRFLESEQPGLCGFRGRDRQLPSPKHFLGF
jgi:hypothetical protein